MNAVEKLEAAIAKLEAIKAIGWPCRDWSYSAARHIARNCEIECEHSGTDGEHPGWSRYETGCAIFDLVQTIDAQLSLLRNALGMKTPFAGLTLHDDAIELELGLADAILGSES